MPKTSTAYDREIEKDRAIKNLINLPKAYIGVLIIP
jgi:hypothetical protein